MEISGEERNKNPEGNLAQAPKIDSIVLADGKEYKLLPFDLNMLSEVEDKFDSSFTELITQGRAKVIRFILFLRLKNYPELTEEKVGQLLTVDKMVEAYQKIAG